MIYLEDKLLLMKRNQKHQENDDLDLDDEHEDLDDDDLIDDDHLDDLIEITIDHHIIDNIYILNKIVQFYFIMIKTQV